MVLLLALAACCRWTASAADPEALAGGTVTIGGVAIRYVDTGPSGGGPTLLCVHGYNGSLTDMLPLLRRLPSSWRLVAVDLPGNGRSGKPDTAYSISGFVDFLASFCAETGLSRFVLLGHSMGGQVVLHFTRRFPGMVERLVLLDPYGLEGEAGAWMLLAHLGPIVDIAMALNTRLFLEIAMKGNFYDPGKATGEYLDAAADALLSPEGRISSARITREVLGTEPVDGFLPQIGQATLLLWGEQDRILDSRWARRFADLLPRAELHLLPRCGHSPALELPEETAALIRKFVNGKE